MAVLIRSFDFGRKKMAIRIVTVLFQQHVEKYGFHTADKRT